MNFSVSTVTTHPSTFQQIPRTYLYLLKQSCKRVTAKQQAAEKGILFSDPMTSTQRAHIFFESTMEGACSRNDGHSRGSMTETISWVNLLKAFLLHWFHFHFLFATERYLFHGSWCMIDSLTNLGHVDFWERYAESFLASLYECAILLAGETKWIRN